MRSEIWVVLTVSVLMITSFAIQPSAPGGEVEMTVEGDAGSKLLHYSLPGAGSAYPATVMALPIDLYRLEDVNVLLEVGGDGPADTGPANLQGLIDHLSAELENIGSSRKITTVDRPGLDSFFSAGNGTLIVATSLWNNPELCQLAQEWVLRGGVLICIGPGTVPLSTCAEGSLELRFAALDYKGGEGLEETSFSEALCLRTVAPLNGILAQDVLAAGGMVLGQLYDRTEDLTTMALVPYGLGSLLLLGGPIDTPFRASMEDVVAWDIARCLEAGVPFSSGPPEYIRLTVGTEGAEGTMSLAGPIDLNYAIVGQSNDDMHNIYGIRTVIF